MKKKFSAEQHQQVSQALATISERWVRGAGTKWSDDGFFVSYEGVTGPFETMMSAIDAKIIQKLAVPQRRGGPTDKILCVGMLPSNVHFRAEIYPHVTQGAFNVDLCMYPVDKNAEAAPPLREIYLHQCEALLGDELKDPEFLAYFLRRQCENFPDRRLGIAAELARFIAEELSMADERRSERQAS